MNQGMMNTIISAVVGGIVGAGVVFFAGGTGKKLELTDLKVANLTITEQATLLNKEGTPELMLKDGSILAENVILAKKMIARQLQAHAMVANRIFASPDDLVATPMEQWKFYAEIGASTQGGGEIVVRSAAGPASVNKPTNSGSLFRMGYDPESRPQMLALYNPSRSKMEINYNISDMQQQEMSANMVNPQGMMPQAPGNFNSPSAIPVNNEMIPSTPVVAQPDGGNVRL